MVKDLFRIPQCWPEDWSKELVLVLTETPSRARRDQVCSAAKRHLDFCERRDLTLLTYPSIFQHAGQLSQEFCEEIAGAHTFALARIALKGRDKTLRDQLHEHFLDKRSSRQLLEASYVPRQARQIGLRYLERQEINRRESASCLRVPKRLSWHSGAPPRQKSISVRY